MKYKKIHHTMIVRWIVLFWRYPFQCLTL